MNRIAIVLLRFQYLININNKTKVVDAELESDAKSLAEKDGWILKQSFIKYALNTELCKDDPQEKVMFSQLQ